MGRRKVDLAFVPDRVLCNAAQNMGWDAEDFRNPRSADIPKEFRDQLAELSGKELFDRYCEWNGLVHWGNSLWDIVQELQVAEGES